MACTRGQLKMTNKEDILTRLIVADPALRVSYLKTIDNYLSNIHLKFKEANANAKANANDKERKLTDFLEHVRVHVVYHDHLTMDNSLKTSQIYPFQTENNPLSNPFEGYMDTTERTEAGAARNYTFHQVDSLILTVYNENIPFRCIDKLLELYVSNTGSENDINDIKVLVEMLYRFVIICQSEKDTIPDYNFQEDFVKHIVFLKELGSYIQATAPSPSAQAPAPATAELEFLSAFMAMGVKPKVEVSLMSVAKLKMNKQTFTDQFNRIKLLVQHTIMMHDEMEQALQKAISNKSKPQASTQSQQVSPPTKKPKRQPQAVVIVQSAKEIRNAKLKNLAIAKAKLAAETRAIRLSNRRKLMDTTPQTKTQQTLLANQNATMNVVSPPQQVARPKPSQAPRANAQLSSLPTNMNAQSSLQPSQAPTQAKTSQANMVANVSSLPVPASSVVNSFMDEQMLDSSPLTWKPQIDAKGYLRNKIAHILATQGYIEAQIDMIFQNAQNTGAFSNKIVNDINTVCNSIVFHDFISFSDEKTLPPSYIDKTIGNINDDDVQALKGELSEMQEKFVLRVEFLQKRALDRYVGHFEQEIRLLLEKKKLNSIAQVKNSIAQVKNLKNSIAQVKNLKNSQDHFDLSTSQQELQALREKNIQHLQQHVTLMSSKEMGCCSKESCTPINLPQTRNNICRTRDQAIVLHDMLSDPSTTGNTTLGELYSSVTAMEVSTPNTHSSQCEPMNTSGGGRHKSKSKPKRSVSPPRPSKSRRPTRRGS
jgi:hypothetical protein